MAGAEARLEPEAPRSGLVGHDERDRVGALDSGGHDAGAPASIGAQRTLQAGGVTFGSNVTLTGAPVFAIAPIGGTIHGASDPWSPQVNEPSSPTAASPGGVSPTRSASGGSDSDAPGTGVRSVDREAAGGAVEVAG